MTLYKLKAAPLVLIEDDMNKNVIPLLSELANYEKGVVNVFCYEQPVSFWKTVFRDKQNIKYYVEFIPNHLDQYIKQNALFIIDSVVQMSLTLGWNECLLNLKKLSSNPNTSQVITVLHRDCLSHFSKLQTSLNHIANAIVSYDSTNGSNIKIQLKKSGKIVHTAEQLAYDTRTGTLKSSLVIKEEKKVEEPVKPQPGNLTTFKIETEQSEKLEAYKLKLPYMSKINEGQSKVYYEPDAVDDWDEEDPDEDLDL